ncbi:ligand-binding protein SH3 [Aeromicrobium sp. A1-2]|uniref:SH3 domain-containing protein n=1 Tax=Aeromicrobium sp. A1-2 TaxID=2107713 RepID=UPI000E54398A|nr:SH3 domain-containing protein [Aeromicrobium sp. A1-2]AXT84794.1 ligand-binding protein SH3 [Aeromicrobium sp. A1-2]
MAHSRHRQVRKAPRSLRATHAILPVAGLLTVAAAGALVITDQDAQPAAVVSAVAAPKQDLFAASAEELPTEVNRSAERAPLTNEAAAEDKIEGTRFAVVQVEVHAAAKGSSPVLAEVASGKTVDITGKTSGDWSQIIHKGLPRWVPTASLAKEMPLGSSPCASGSGSESGLRPDTVKVHRAVCAKFPSIVRYGGVAGRGEHATGQALDIMVSSDVGNEVAAFLMEHRAELGVEYIIWRQRIWRPATSPNWRGMSDRGGATANHMDHVHVTTYGNAAQ